MFPFAFLASAARFLHSPTHCISEFLCHKAQMRPVEMTVTVRGTFEKSTYGLCVSVRSLENAMPSPVEKGDRGAVDKDYPGIKENETNEKKRLSQVTLEKNASFVRFNLHFMSECLFGVKQNVSARLSR